MEKVQQGFGPCSERASNPKQANTLTELYKSFETNPEQIFGYAIQEADKSIQWYRIHAHRNQIATQILRWFAAILATVAGVFPVLSNLLYAQVSIDPAWATVLTAAAALLVALDQLSGCSSKYMQFKSAQLRIERLQRKFVFDILATKFPEHADAADKSSVADVIAICAKFVESVDKIVLDETGAWIDDFKAALTKMNQDSNVNSSTGPSST